MPVRPTSLAIPMMTAQAPRPNKDQKAGMAFSAQLWAWLVSTVKLQTTIRPRTTQQAMPTSFSLF